MAKFVITTRLFEAYTDKNSDENLKGRSELLAWDGRSLRTINGDKWYWASECKDPSYWKFVHEGELETLGDLGKVARTFHFTVPDLVPEKYMKARAKLAENVINAKWRLLLDSKQLARFMPPKIYWKSYMDFCKKLSDELDRCSLEYYNSLEMPSFTFSKIDLKAYRELMADPNTVNKAVLKSFNLWANASEEALEAHLDPVTYTREKTRTGRLVVDSGPNILTLKKEYRKLFKSFHGKEGKIWSFDYTSLEPRVLLLLGRAIKKHPDSTPLIGSLPRDTMAQDLPQDIYLKVLEDLGLSGKIPRNIAKTAILATLYGQSEYNASKALKNHISKPEDFLAAISDYFGVEALQKSLARDLVYSNRNQIKSYYGRIIPCEDTRPTSLLNYYVQATAVDVALKGFCKILNRLNNEGLYASVSPKFCLHDALVMDINNEYDYLIPQIENVGSKRIPGFDGANFFLRVQEFVPSTSTPSQEEEEKEVSESITEDAHV